MNNGRNFGVARPSSTLGAPHLVLGDPDDFPEPGMRSEAVGAEHDARLDAEGTSLLRWFFIGLGLLAALLIAAHFIAAWWQS